MHPAQSAIQELKYNNGILSEENDLLKEQLKLRKDALRLHGIHILGDVIHMLDQHHIHCVNQNLKGK